MEMEKKNAANAHYITGHRKQGDDFTYKPNPE